MELTDRQIRDGYWYFQPDEGFPPKGKLLEDYNGEECFALLFTKGNESYRVIKKRENDYRNKIPGSLSKLKILWADHCGQDTFDSICTLENLNSLYINSSSVRNLSALSDLKNLKHLALLNMTKVESIEPISRLNQLQTLKLEHFKKITDFSSIAALTNLQGLQIDGDMYTSQIIEDFEFLNILTKLEYLTFNKSRLKDKNFDSISKLANLKMIQCSANYPKKEFRKLCDMKCLKHIGGNIQSKIYS